ncbi:type II toxin-antitoxin system RelE family toxin, partial [Xenorhabdus bovienii]|uniref:type II toxin-antitoxin system RelE family toxin n=1 Tax=Xenorhabdus bovienii TaxID=40576 RepID=UPI003BAC314B
LGYTIREQLKKKLAERLKNPHVPASRLSGRTNRYKIKLKMLVRGDLRRNQSSIDRNCLQLFVKVRSAILLSAN